MLDKSLKTYLLINRLIIALLACVAIWSETLLSELAATVSTILWLFMGNAITAERICVRTFMRSIGK